VSVVVTFEDYTPTPRYDSLPWTSVQIQESTTETGSWTTIDTIALSPVDSDPTDPAARSFTTENGTATDLWYRVVFVDADGDTLQPTTPVQNLSAPAETTPYATTAEFFRRVNVRAPTADQTTAAEHVLLAAAGEIDSELDRAGAALAGWELSLAKEVNLERAQEHWQSTPFGLVGLGGELGSAFTSRDSWERYALKLAPLKIQFGLA
jgi:hypothetical protein